jgi:hypothetical protein
MYTLKGFLGIESLVLNEAGVTSPIGEISTYSLTYSKNVGLYPSQLHPQLMLYAFSSHLTAGVPVLVPTEISDSVFEMGSWTHAKQTTPGASSSQASFLQDFVQQFSAAATMLDCGQMVQVTGDVWFPEWVSWKLTGLPVGHPAADNTIFLWLSDESFSHQYDEYAIVVVPPLANIDAFFAGAVSVKAALEARTLTQVMTEAQLAKDGYPESIMAAESYDYVDLTKPTNRLPTAWTLLIYGKAGEDVDAIREAIRAYIAAHSSHTEAEWQQIFPDIYKFTEVVIYPRWHNYAIADRALQRGIYSPAVRLKDELVYLKARLPAFPAAFVDTYASVIPCNYKSLALLLIGTPDNRNALYSIATLYPDLINVPTSDTLFEMMAESTQNWVLAMERAIVAAESLTTYADVPSGLRKVNRNGILYVTARIDNVTYLVASKATTPVY